MNTASCALSAPGAHPHLRLAAGRTVSERALCNIGDIPCRGVQLFNGVVKSRERSIVVNAENFGDHYAVPAHRI